MDDVDLAADPVAFRIELDTLSIVTHNNDDEDGVTYRWREVDRVRYRFNTVGGEVEFRNINNVVVWVFGV